MVGKGGKGTCQLERCVVAAVAKVMADSCKPGGASGAGKRWPADFREDEDIALPQSQPESEQYAGNLVRQVRPLGSRTAVSHI